MAVKPETMPPLVTLAGVDVVATGTWDLSSGEETFTAEDLANGVDAATCPSIGTPVIKLGHVDPRFDGEPAVGRVANMELTASGNKITGDLEGMPGWLGEVIGSAYPNRSIEAFRNVTCQQGHSHPFVITAVALLGVAPPGVGVLNSLEDVAKLYGVAATGGDTLASGEKVRVTMSVGEQVMAAGVTVDDVRRAYMATAGYSRWITSMQLDPPQLIVCDDGTDKLYRVPVSIKGGQITFGDAVEVAIEYADVAAAAKAGLFTPLMVHASAQEFADSLPPDIKAAWSASTQLKNLGDNPGKSQLSALFAIPGDTKSDSKLPHHTVSSDGKVGAADMDGVHAAMAALNGGRGGLKGVSADAKKAAYNHLAGHYRSAGEEPPEMKAAAEAAAGHGAYSGEHEHPHPAFGSQGGDATHTHMHSHSGDAAHSHDHPMAKKTATGGKTVKRTKPSGQTREDADVFTDEQMAELRAALGKGDDEELTGEEILAALKKVTPKKDGEPKAKKDGEPEGEPEKVAAARARMPKGAVVLDQEQYEKLQASAAKGEKALRRMEISERDEVIDKAIKAGKFSVARRPHWQRLWDADPDGTREVIAGLAKNVVPVHDIGQAGRDIDETELELDEDFKALYPPGEWQRREGARS